MDTEDSLVLLKAQLLQLKEEALKFKLKTEPELKRQFQVLYGTRDEYITQLNTKKVQLNQYKVELEDHPDKKEQSKPLIQKIEPMAKDLGQRLIPATGSLFVRFFLGRVNVKLYRDGEKVRLKSEYEKFRSRTNVLIILSGLLQLIFPNAFLLQALFQVWLIYYYVTLALREHILKVNGSNINRWWMLHHYLAITLSVVILTWNWESAPYRFFYPQMMVFTICQGIVQVLMNRYQIGRLYNLVARGEASRMDVTPETVDPRFVPSMTMLMPFLIFVQLFQAYNAYTLFYFYYHHPNICSYHTIIIASLFSILSAGNLWTTLGTFIRKRLLSGSQALSAAVGMSETKEKK